MLNLLVTAVELDYIKSHVVVKQVIDVEGAFISLKSTTVKRSYGILTLVTPLGVGGALRGKIVSMVYLVANIIELSSET